MQITKIIDAFGYVIYGALALLAVWGVYNAILLYRNLARSRSTAGRPRCSSQVRELLQGRQVRRRDRRSARSRRTGTRRWRSSWRWP